MPLLARGASAWGEQAASVTRTRTHEVSAQSACRVGTRGALVEELADEEERLCEAACEGSLA